MEGRSVRQIGLSFDNGRVRPSPPSKQPYGVFVAAADTEKKKQEELEQQSLAALKKRYSTVQQHFHNKSKQASGEDSSNEEGESERNAAEAEANSKGQTPAKGAGAENKEHSKSSEQQPPQGVAEEALPSIAEDDTLYERVHAEDGMKWNWVEASIGDNFLIPVEEEENEDEDEHHHSKAVQPVVPAANWLQKRNSNSKASCAVSTQEEANLNGSSTPQSEAGKESTSLSASATLSRTTMAATAGNSNTVAVGRTNTAARNDYLVDQQILLDSDTPNLDIIDESLLTDEDRKRLNREVKKMTAEEQLHHEKLQPFLDKEQEIEDARFRNETWLTLVSVGFAAACFGNAVETYRASNKIFNVITPHVRRKMEVWRRKAQQTALKKQHMNEVKPRIEFLKKYSTGKFFADWPERALQDLVNAMDVCAVEKHTCIFHQGDINDDIYFVAEGVVDLVVMNGSNPAKPKSKRHDNGVVVDTKYKGHMFGEGAHFTREPRSATAIAMEYTVLFKVTRDQFILASSTLPDITFECLKNRSIAQREENIKKVFPIPIHKLQENSVFQCWHAAGVSELVQAFSPELKLKGSPLYEVGDEDTKVYYIVSGAVESTIEEKGQTVTKRYGPGECVGEEEAVLGEARTSSARCLKTCELWSLDRNMYLPVSMRNAICAVESRQQVNLRRANRLLRPGTCPPCAIHHPVLHYLVPTSVLEAMWAHAVPLVFSQGETICTESDACRNIFVITSGTVYQRYGPEGPNTPDCPDVKLQHHVIVKDLPHKGYVVGAVEYGLGKSNYLSSVRCTSEVTVWAIRTSLLENHLSSQHALVLGAIKSHITHDVILKHFLNHTLDDLDHESVPPYRAGLRRF